MQTQATQGLSLSGQHTWLLHRASDAATGSEACVAIPVSRKLGPRDLFQCITFPSRNIRKCLKSWVKALLVHCRPEQAFWAPKSLRLKEILDNGYIKVVSLSVFQPDAQAGFTPGKIPGSHFCQSLHRHQGHYVFTQQTENCFLRLLDSSRPNGHIIIQGSSAAEFEDSTS
jgi:hypothetical protein